MQWEFSSWKDKLIEVWKRKKQLQKKASTGSWLLLPNPSTVRLTESPEMAVSLRWRKALPTAAASWVWESASAVLIAYQVDVTGSNEATRSDGPIGVRPEHHASPAHVRVCILLRPGIPLLPFHFPLQSVQTVLPKNLGLHATATVRFTAQCTEAFPKQPRSMIYHHDVILATKTGL